MRIEELVQWIAQRPEQPGWEPRRWQDALDELGAWRELVAEPAHWPAWERARPRSDDEHLWHVVLAAAGVGLARHWLTADDVHQRRAAEAWWRDNIDQVVDTPEWHALTAHQRQRAIDSSTTRLEQLLEQHERLRHAYQRELSDVQRLGSRAALAGDHATSQYIDDVLEQFADMWPAPGGASQRAVRRYAPTPTERRLLAQLLEHLWRAGYEAVALPPIIMSDEPPPLFVRYPELESEETPPPDGLPSASDVPHNPARSRPEHVAIEEVLGIYQPVDMTIVLYARGIAWYGHHVAASADLASVRAIALLHLAAHWASHALARPDMPPWTLEGYRQCDTQIREGWAQLLTSWVVRDVGGTIEPCFDGLNAQLTAPFRTFQSFTRYSTAAVIESLDVLRSIGDGATVRDWRAAIERYEQPSTAGPTDGQQQPMPTDGRPDTDRVGAEYVSIPAGAGLAAFRIMRTPVTNAMWRQAVAAGACEPPRRTGAYEDSGKQHHPVVHVTRAMALRYAAWVDGRLPHEAEWTRAARGDDARRYPWGDKPPQRNLANTENQIGATTSVLGYPEGASPFGVLDMAGNVWEMVWPAGDDDRFVMCGGAYYSDAADVGCDARLEETEDAPSGFIGFRVVAAGG